MSDMETTTVEVSEVFKSETRERSRFNLELIEGLYRCRHKRPELRPWLRQSVELERHRRREGRS